MASHININEFKNELWFDEIKSNIIDTIADYNTDYNIDLQFLDNEYSINGSDTIFVYKTNLEYDGYCCDECEQQWINDNPEIVEQLNEYE